MVKIGIVIQGPTTLYKDILNHYENCKPVVWSTWENEPDENIQAIKNSSMEILLNIKPEDTGHWNCNLQCVSSLNGIKYLKNKYPDIDRFIKIRSDLIISPVDELKKSVNSSLDSSAICTMGYFAAFPFTLVPDYFMMDFMIAGRFDSLVKFFSASGADIIGKPFPEKGFETNYFNSPVYIKSNLKKLKQRLFFIKWDQMSFYFLRDRYNSSNYRITSGYLVNEPSIKESLKYFFWIYPKSKVKKILGRQPHD